MSIALNTPSAAQPFLSLVSKRLAAVQLRPGMYVRQLGPDGLQDYVNQLVSDLLVNASPGHRIEVVVHDDLSLTIASNASELSTAIDPTSGVAMTTIALTMGPCETNKYQSEPRGAWIFNALSHRFELRTTNSGFVWGQDFIDGAQANVFHCMRAQGNEDTGIRIRVWPGSRFFGEDGVDCPFDIVRLQASLQTLAYLHPGVAFITRDERLGADPQNSIVQFEEKTFTAILDKHACRFGTPLTAPILIEDTIKTSSGSVYVRVAFQLFASRHCALSTFVNDERTTGDPFTATTGTHEDGFLESVLNAITPPNQPSPFFNRDAFEGVAAAVHVKLANAAFGSAEKATLSNSNVRDAVNTLMSRFLTKNPDITAAFLEKAKRAVRIRSTNPIYAF